MAFAAVLVLASYTNSSNLCFSSDLSLDSFLLLCHDSCSFTSSLFASFDSSVFYFLAGVVVAASSRKGLRTSGDCKEFIFSTYRRAYFDCSECLGYSTSKAGWGLASFPSRASHPGSRHSTIATLGFSKGLVAYS